MARGLLVEPGELEGRPQAALLNAGVVQKIIVARAEHY